MKNDPSEMPDEELDELSQEWLDALCHQVQHDEKLRSAIEMVAALHQLLCEGQPVPETHLPMLRQMLAAFAIIKVQEIGWDVDIQYRKNQDDKKNKK